MDIKKIKELVEIVEQSSLTELEIKEKDFKIKLSKNKEEHIIQQMTMPNTTSQTTLQDNTPTIVSEETSITLKAPLVGTFYSKPAPDKQAFAAVGSKVSKGDVVCIIEAMKVMNEIKAETGGIVKAILVEEGQLVEFDQPLFELE